MGNHGQLLPGIVVYTAIEIVNYCTAGIKSVSHQRVGAAAPARCVAIIVMLLLLLLFCAMPWSAGSKLGEALTAEQLQHLVDSAIASRAASVDVPGGDYLFNHSGGTDFSVLGASGLRIRALGRVTLWFAGSAGVNITDSTDVQLIGDGSTGAWTLDYDPPPTKQELAGSTLNLLNCTRVVAEDVTIRAAPYMAVTAWNGGGAHVFRRLTFGPPKTGATRGLVSLRDAMHFSDQRIGPTVVDSVIGFTGDDFFNVRARVSVLSTHEYITANSGYTIAVTCACIRRYTPP